MLLEVNNEEDFFYYETEIETMINTDLKTIKEIIMVRSCMSNIFQSEIILNINIEMKLLLTRLYNVIFNKKKNFSFFSIMFEFNKFKEFCMNKELQEFINIYKKYENLKKNEFEIIFSLFGKELEDLSKKKKWCEFFKFEISKNTKIKLKFSTDSKLYNSMKNIPDFLEKKRKRNENEDNNIQEHPKKKQKLNIKNEKNKNNTNNIYIQKEYFISEKKMEYIQKSDNLKNHLNDSRIQDMIKHINSISHVPTKIQLLNNLRNEYTFFDVFINKMLYVVGEKDSINQNILK